jgi:hypothetical protein
MVKKILWLLSLAALIAGGAPAAKVVTDYSHSTDFSRFKTYSWLKVDAGDSLWEDRIMHAVDAQLAARGLTKVPQGGDLAVAALGAAHNEQTLYTFYDTFGGGWYWHGFGTGTAITTVENTPVGTLALDLFEGSTKKLVWRGTASDTLSHKPEKNEKKLVKAVGKMFEHFPPPPRG